MAYAGIRGVAPRAPLPCRLPRARLHLGLGHVVGRGGKGTSPDALRARALLLGRRPSFFGDAFRRLGSTGCRGRDGGREQRASPAQVRDRCAGSHPGSVSRRRSGDSEACVSWRPPPRGLLRLALLRFPEDLPAPHPLRAPGDPGGKPGLLRGLDRHPPHPPAGRALLGRPLAGARHRNPGRDRALGLSCGRRSRPGDRSGHPAGGGDPRLAPEWNKRRPDGSSPPSDRARPERRPRSGSRPVGAAARNPFHSNAAGGERLDLGPCGRRAGCDPAHRLAGTLRRIDPLGAARRRPTHASGLVLAGPTRSRSVRLPAGPGRGAPAFASSRFPLALRAGSGGSFAGGSSGNAPVRTPTPRPDGPPFEQRPPGPSPFDEEDSSASFALASSRGRGLGQSRRPSGGRGGAPCGRNADDKRQRWAVSTGSARKGECDARRGGPGLRPGVANRALSGAGRRSGSRCGRGARRSCVLTARP
jgi:hypothetical protein